MFKVAIKLWKMEELPALFSNLLSKNVVEETAIVFN
jgi:hypothetical protein